MGGEASGRQSELSRGSRSPLQTPYPEAGALRVRRGLVLGCWSNWRQTVSRSPKGSSTATVRCSAHPRRSPHLLRYRSPWDPGHGPLGALRPGDSAGGGGCREGLPASGPAGAVGVCLSHQARQQRMTPWCLGLQSSTLSHTRRTGACACNSQWF